MMDLKKTSPLDEAAILDYEPTNKQLFVEIRRQNKAINECVELGKKTNGRVTLLEATVAPHEHWYQRFKTLSVIIIFIAPFIVSALTKIFELALNHLLK